MTLINKRFPLCFLHFQAKSQSHRRRLPCHSRRSPECQSTVRLRPLRRNQLQVLLALGLLRLRGRGSSHPGETQDRPFSFLLKTPPTAPDSSQATPLLNLNLILQILGSWAGRSPQTSPRHVHHGPEQGEFLLPGAHDQEGLLLLPPDPPHEPQAELQDLTRQEQRKPPEPDGQSQPEDSKDREEVAEEQPEPGEDREDQVPKTERREQGI